jgi:hypothetical protein
MPDAAFLIAASGLGLSGIVSGAKLISWFLQGDPKAIAQAGRWGGAGLFALSIPLLLGLVMNQRWSEAVGLSAVMLMAFALYGPRVFGQFLPRGRVAPDRSRPSGRPGDWEFAQAAPDDAERVQRSIAVLEEYLSHTTGAFAPDASGGRRRRGLNGARRELTSPFMSEAEALQVLGLGAEAEASEINEAHRRLMQIIHPDRGGSPYFAVKVNQAKEVLLSRIQPPSGAEAGAASRKRRRRNEGEQDLSQPKSATGG